MAQATEETAAAGGRARRDEEEPRQLEGEPGHGPQRLHATAADSEATVRRARRSSSHRQGRRDLEVYLVWAVGQAYSLARLSLGLGMRTHAVLAGSEVLVPVKRLARRQHSAALAQLASRVDAVLRCGDSSTLLGD